MQGWSIQMKKLIAVLFMMLISLNFVSAKETSLGNYINYDNAWKTAIESNNCVHREYIRYENLKNTEKIRLNAIDSYNSLYETNPDLRGFCNKATISFYKNDKYKVEIVEFKCSQKNNDEYQLFCDECDNVIEQLYSTGKIDDTMTIKQKTNAIYNYIVENVTYDKSLLGRTGYDALNLHSATCLGITGAFVRLCRLVGINAYGHVIDGVKSDHICITVLDENNNEFYCDATYGISAKKGNTEMNWFWLTSEQYDNNKN